MTEPKVDFKLAKLLKEAGFDWQVNSFWYEGEPEQMLFTNSKERNHNDVECACSAPNLAHAAQWLREVHGLHIICQPHCKQLSGYWFASLYIPKGSEWRFFTGISDDFTSHDTALSAGIEHALKIIIERKK